MDSQTFEFTVHRIGGPDDVGRLERTWGPYLQSLVVGPGAFNTLTVQGVHVANSFLYLELSAESYAAPEWLSGRMTLSDMNRRPLGPARPFLLYERVCEVPFFTPFFDRWDNSCYTVGIRRPGSLHEPHEPLLTETEQERDRRLYGDTSPEARLDAEEQARDGKDPF